MRVLVSNTNPCHTLALPETKTEAVYPGVVPAFKRLVNRSSTRYSCLRVPVAQIFSPPIRVRNIRVAARHALKTAIRREKQEMYRRHDTVVLSST